MDNKRQRKQNVTFIILKTKNIGEKDKLVFLYTNEFGLLHTIAKNSRKLTSHFTGKLIPLSCGNAEIYFSPKRILIIEIKSKNIIGDENNLETIQYTQEIAHITKIITPEEQKYDNLIELLKTTVFHIRQPLKKNLIFAGFIIKLFELAGLIPDFKSIDSKTEEKYLKLFHFLKTQKFKEIIKISLTSEENKYLKSKIQSLIDRVI